jgi:hypothetical protein
MKHLYSIRYHWTDRFGSSYMAGSVCTGPDPDTARREFLRQHPHIGLAEIIGTGTPIPELPVHAEEAAC